MSLQCDMIKGSHSIWQTGDTELVKVTGNVLVFSPLGKKPETLLLNMQQRVAGVLKLIS